MGRQVFVDGYNVIHADGRLAAVARSNIDYARDTLIAQLSADPRLRHDAITVVFDGTAAGYRRSYQAYGRVQVRFSGPGRSADDLIRQLVGAAGGDSIVISNDREVQWSAYLAGGSSLKVRVDRPDARPPQRPTSAANGYHPTSDDDTGDDDPLPTFGKKKGNPNRAPRRRAREREERRYW